MAGALRKLKRKNNDYSKNINTKNMEIQENNYAGFWRRVAALILDDIIIIFFSISLFSIIYFAVSVNYTHTFTEDYKKIEAIAYLIWGIYLLFIRWAYYAGMESSPFKATVGKIITGLYVTNLKGERVSFGQASGRFFGKILSGLILGIGYIMAGTTETKQALHDKVSDCLVLKR